VRRRDPVWGDAATAAQANLDTFSYVNAAPPAALFNQGELLWLGLEDHVLTHASTYRTRLSVFTAPVLADDDPVYRGVQVPRRFWKIAAWATAEGEGAGLAATGYVLDQSDQLDGILLAQSRSAGVVVPPLGPYLTYQVPVADIAVRTCGGGVQSSCSAGGCCGTGARSCSEPAGQRTGTDSCSSTARQEVTSGRVRSR
jgi:endonuclease G